MTGLCLTAESRSCRHVPGKPLRSTPEPKVVNVPRPKGLKDPNMTVSMFNICKEHAPHCVVWSLNDFFGGPYHSCAKHWTNPDWLNPHQNQLSTNSSFTCRHTFLDSWHDLEPHKPLHPMVFTPHPALMLHALWDSKNFAGASPAQYSPMRRALLIDETTRQETKNG